MDQGNTIIIVCVNFALCCTVSLNVGKFIRRIYFNDKIITDKHFFLRMKELRARAAMAMDFCFYKCYVTRYHFVRRHISILLEFYLAIFPFENLNKLKSAIRAS